MFLSYTYVTCFITMLHVSIIDSFNCIFKYYYHLYLLAQNPADIEKGITYTSDDEGKKFNDSCSTILCLLHTLYTNDVKYILCTSEVKKKKEKEVFILILGNYKT